MNKSGVYDLRLAEVRYAIQRLRSYPWVGDIILAGFSEGGATTQIYDGPEPSAKIILGVACWSASGRNHHWHGVAGPIRPVLSIRGSNDYHMRDTDAENRHCGEWTKGWPGSRSVVIKGAGHAVLEHEEGVLAVEQFLATLGVSK